MSDQNPVAGGAEDGTNSVGTEKEQFVHKKAFEDVTKDMHKFKTKLKDKEAYIAELEAKQAAIEEASLAEKQQYKELFEKRNDEFERLKKEVEERDLKYLEAVKRNALKQELGSKIKDEYLVHANLKDIQFGEGNSIDRDSLVNVANSFRERYPELVPSEQTSQVTGTSSPSNTTVGSNLKPLSQMNLNERKALLNDAGLQEEYRKKGLL